MPSGWSACVRAFRKESARATSWATCWGAGTTIWAVGDASVAQCTIGAGCTHTPIGTGALYGVWASGANNVWAVGAGGRILRNTGTGWNAVTSPTSRALYRVHGSAPDHIYAVGDSVMLQFDGSQWATVKLDSQLSDALRYAGSVAPTKAGLFVRSKDEFYVAGNRRIVRWNGFEWDSFALGKEHRPFAALSIGPNGCGLAVTNADNMPPTPAATLVRGIGPSGCFSQPMGAPTSWP
ncbi:MAG: hypothetical protein FJ202_08430 [Gemmatimonadetes bacterium]|nr:hypothetical protein [Gemmatimonadota bacterium]